MRHPNITGCASLFAVERLVATAMQLSEISHLVDRPIHRLSYSEIKRKGPAGLIAMRPLLLLYEPKANLDPAEATRLLAGRGAPKID